MWRVKYHHVIRSHLTRGAWIEIRSIPFVISLFKSSHLTRGAWIEIPAFARLVKSAESRTSHEVRGLKFFRLIIFARLLLSHLTRGAWIEIAYSHCLCPQSGSRTSHEVRGLKSIAPARLLHPALGRTSHEVRGLKYIIMMHLIIW